DNAPVASYQRTPRQSPTHTGRGAMTNSSIGFTPTDLIAAASQTLTDGGYHQVAGRFQEWDTPSARLFENEYNVVGIAVFDTCGELLGTWPDLQGSLVDV